MSWSSIGGEAAGLLNENHLAADGIENVIKVLEELEDEKLQELDFIELNACSGGCVGGIFAAENGYVARARIQRLRKYLPVSCNRLQDAGDPERLEWTEQLEYAPVMSLAGNVEEAMRLMKEIDFICDRLPQLDCGSCGAPPAGRWRRMSCGDWPGKATAFSGCGRRYRKSPARLVSIEGTVSSGERPETRGKKRGRCRRDRTGDGRKAGVEMAGTR